MAHSVPVQAPDCIAHACPDCIPVPVALQQPVSSAKLARWRTQANYDRVLSSARQAAKSNPQSELFHQAMCARWNVTDFHEESLS